MMEIDDDLLMAFADGELDAVTMKRVERAVAQDPALQSRLDAQRRLRARLEAHYAPAIEEEVPERLRAMLETNVVDLPAARAQPARPIWQSFAAIAATLVIGLALGRALPSVGQGPASFQDGAIVARGNLADALDTQLASAQPANAATRIGITFASNDGRLCRTFDDQDLAGLACRRVDGWQLVMTTAGSRGSGSEFRQAASGNPLVLQAAQDLLSGEPLDAAAERRARDSGWRPVSGRR
jgi:hypothetical protein